MKTSPSSSSPLEAAEQADILLILTEWNEFRSIDLSEVKSHMRGQHIFDGRNIYNPTEMQKLGFHYESIGRQGTYQQEKGQLKKEANEASVSIHEKA